MTQQTNFPPNIDRQTCGSMPRARTLETHAERGHDTTSISSIGPASTASADTRRPASAASEQQIRARSQIQENDADNCRIGGCGKLFHMSVQPSRLYGNGTHCHRKTATGEKQVLTQHTNLSPNIDRQTCCSTPRARTCSYVPGLASVALAPALAYDINLAGCFLSALVPALSTA